MAKTVKKTTRKTTTKKSTTKPQSRGVTKSRTRKVETPTEDQVRERAYQVYLRRNGGPGNPEADWHQAQRELAAELKQS